jgi:predicted Rossmann fold flavoprotein
VLEDADQQGLCDLAGISTAVEVSIGKRRFREKLLVTHRGLSGPAILQISSYWHDGQAIAIDWAPGIELLSGLLLPNVRRDAAAARVVLREHPQTSLPHRLIDRLMDVANCSDWSNRGIAALEGQMHKWEFTPAGTEGYEKAEVTAGGVDTDELSAQTMESKRVPGLYFIGEVVDVTGQLGGFNFQWAWASGAAAGRAV